MDKFNPARLTLARTSFGWTKVQLAQAVSLTPRRIADYENKGDAPPAATINELAAALKVTPEFLSQSAPPDITEPSFRSMRAMPASIRDRAIATAQMTVEVSQWIGERMDLPACRVPRDLAGVSPSLAAASIREQWGLGLQPAPNLIHLAELMGVRVFALSIAHRTMDAFSFWHDDTPFILINARGTAERRRWDVAHEVGHIVLHAGGHHVAADRGREEEADAFASELLLPAEGLRRDAVRPSRLDEVRAHKLRWKVSAMAMIRRLSQLGYLTEWQYRSLVIEASKANLRRVEDDIAVETSPVLTAILSELRQRRLGPRTIAGDLALRPLDVRNMFHTLAPVDLGSAGTPTRTRSTPAGPGLRLVKD